MAINRRAPRDPWSDDAAGAYTLVVRGPDGRPSLERFSDAAAYKARLVALEPLVVAGVSIDELAGLLER